jgi:hypothetical protein
MEGGLPPHNTKRRKKNSTITPNNNKKKTHNSSHWLEGDPYMKNTTSQCTITIKFNTNTLDKVFYQGMNCWLVLQTGPNWSKRLTYKEKPYSSASNAEPTC